MQPGTDLGVHLRDALRRALQTVAVGVFTYRDQNLANGFFDAREIDAFRNITRETHAVYTNPSIGPSYSATNGRLRYRSATSSPYPMTNFGGIRNPTYFS